MEYLRGRDLGVVLKKTKEPLAIEYVADVMLCVCAALRACHQSGVVHRDLKPSNIFLADTDTGPEIKVLDFGVSKAPMAGDLTQEGQILGTPQYLSPEQVNGKVGPESDQYALGVSALCLSHQEASVRGAPEPQSLARYRGRAVPGSTRAPAGDSRRGVGGDHPPRHARQPGGRFESVHALGQALWTFASSRGQVEWKNYYFHTPPASQSAKDTLEGIPLAPTPEPSGGFSPGAAIRVPTRRESTAILPEPTAILQRSVSSDTPGSPSPQLFISTKLAKPTPAAAETPIHWLRPTARADGGSGRRWVWRQGDRCRSGRRFSTP